MTEFLSRWIPLFVFLLLPATAVAGEKTLMHCFTFVTIDTASREEWQAFTKSTEELPSQIPGLKRVWYGKLRRPVVIVGPANADANQLILNSKPGLDLQTTVRRADLRWGVCMEFENEAALKSYARAPAHKAWVEVYKKVRVEGTMTFDLPGK